MKKRLESAIRAISAVIMGFIGMMTFPIWIILWILTGIDIIEWLSRFADPETWEFIDETNKKTAETKKQTEKIREETCKLKAEIKEMEEEIRKRELTNQ